MQFPLKYLHSFHPSFFINPTHLAFLFINIRYRVKQTRNGETHFENLVKNTILSNHFSGLRACVCAKVRACVCGLDPSDMPRSK